MKRWYVVHTFSSYENRIKDTIEKGKIGTELDEFIGEILVPTQKTYIIKDGKKLERERKIFNSYIIVEAEMCPKVYAYIKGISGVTNFLGYGKKPIPLDEKEVNRLLGINDGTDTDTEFDFIPGDLVTITEGAFSDFEGIVEKVDHSTGKITVNVTVFGRITPVEISGEQVEKKDK